MLSPRGVFLHSGYDRRLSFGSLNAREEKYLGLVGLNSALETAARAGYCGSRDLNSMSRSTFKFMLGKHSNENKLLYLNFGSFNFTNIKNRSLRLPAK